MSTPDGGPAFPEMIRSPDGELIGMESGMTLRDWFAGMALQGDLAGETEHFRTEATNKHTREENLAINAYRIADAMLKAREK